MALVASRSNRIKVWTEESSLKISSNGSDMPAPQLNKDNWLSAFPRLPQEPGRADGFERINPSILKAAIQADYPDFDEKAIGFKRFSDIMKRLRRKSC